MTSSSALNDVEKKFLAAVTSDNFNQSEFFKAADDEKVTAIAANVRKAGFSICHVFVKKEVSGQTPCWMTFYFVDGEDIRRYFGDDADVRFPQPPLKVCTRTNEQDSAHHNSLVPEGVHPEAVVEPKESNVTFALLAKLRSK